MSTTQPIRDKEELQAFKSYYKTENPNCRNYCLIVLGLNTALRISDLLSLKWIDLYDYKKRAFRSHLFIKEQKTGKLNYITLNTSATSALGEYFKERNPTEEEYVFSRSSNHYAPLCRSSAYRIVRKAASSIDDSNHISCHSLRKTFGYHAWKSGVPPALLMDIYNHSSYAITKRYLGIDQDDRDQVYLTIEL